MKQISGKDLAKAIQKQGWLLSRVKGIVIPIHGNQSLKIGLLKSLLKIAGLDEDDI